MKTEKIIERIQSYNKIHHDEHLDKAVEILKIATSLVRDSEPFEADKVFIHCDNLRKIMRT